MGAGRSRHSSTNWNSLFILVRSPYTKKAQDGGSCYSTVGWRGQSWGVGPACGPGWGEDLGNQPPLLEWGCSPWGKEKKATGSSESHLCGQGSRVKSGQLGQGLGPPLPNYIQVSYPTWSRGDLRALPRLRWSGWVKKSLLFILPMSAAPGPCSLKDATMLQVSPSTVYASRLPTVSLCSFRLRFLPALSVAMILEMHS